MSWRTVCISNRCKLEYRIGYMVVRGDDLVRINLDEISILILESTTISLTVALLNELIKKKVKIIFCDEQHNPSSELVAYYGSFDTSKIIRQQILWEDDFKQLVWAKIIKEKIHKQSFVLKHFGLNLEASLLESYIEQVEPGDISNREGHAAKVHFNAMFGKEFTRNKECIENACLDYAYSLILACFNREIVAMGCITQLGVWHDNTFNHFNLSSDLMEPFRALVDMNVKKIIESQSAATELNTELKHALLSILEVDAMLNGSVYKLPYAIRIYVQKMIQLLNEEDMGLFPTLSYV